MERERYKDIERERDREIEREKGRGREGRGVAGYCQHRWD